MDAIPLVFTAFTFTYALALWTESLAFRVAGKQPPIQAILYAVAPAFGAAALTVGLCAYLR